MPPRLSLLITLVALALFPAAAQALPAGRTVIVSGNDAMDAALPAPSGWSGIDPRGGVSDDGRYVAFGSFADGLSAEDNNDYFNVFVKDRATGAVTLASRRTGAAGAPAHGDCEYATISDDGKRVAFSCAGPLDPADTNQHRDVYVRDLQAQTTTLVSRATAGAVANDDAEQPMIAGDGGAVVFRSTATNLDPADPNPRGDIFRRTLGASPKTLLVSRADGLAGAVGDGASLAPSVTDDGTLVSFGTVAANLTTIPDLNDRDDIYVRDIPNGTTVLASAPDLSSAATGNGHSEVSVISGQPNGGQYYVAFGTASSNLGTLDTNGRDDVYRRALVNGGTVLISRTLGPNPGAVPNGGQLGGISDTGLDVGFSTSDPLDPADTTPGWSAYVRHTAAGATELLSRRDDHGPEMSVDSSAPAVSGDGKAYAFSSEGGGGTPDADPATGTAYLRDLHGSPRTTELIARPAGSAPFVNQGAGAWLTSGARTISADGARVVFVATRGGMRQPEAWVRDLRTGALTLASRAGGAGGAPVAAYMYDITISADGNRVAFVTDKALEPADTDGVASVYVRDLAAGRTLLASRADRPAGATADHFSSGPALNADGSRVAFESGAMNLGDGDTDPGTDVHVRDLATGRTLLVSGAANGWSGDPAIDAAGTHVAFASEATNLGDGDADTEKDIHLRDLGTGALRLVSATPGGVKGDDTSRKPQISDDGTVVAFITGAPKLLPDGGAHDHVVVRDLAHDTLAVADRDGAAGGPLRPEHAYDFSLSGDGTKVAWTPAPTYVPDPAAAPGQQVRVRDLVTNTTTIGSRADGPGGAPAARDARNPSLSRDGACLAFATTAPLAAGAGTDYEQAYVRALGDGCAPVPPPPPGGGDGPDTTAPVLSGVTLRRKRFAIGARATARVASRRRGTVLRFTTSEAGTLRVKVQRRVRRHGKVVFRAKAQLRRTVAAGKGRMAFSGRIGRHALRAGRYRMVVRVTDAAGNRSKAAKVRFRIVRLSVRRQGG